MALSESEIAQRIRSGELFCTKFSQNDRQASAKFRDASNVFPYMSDESSYSDPDGGDVPIDVPVGEPNLITNNIIVKNASIAINYPDFQVKSKSANSEYAEVVRKFLKDSFRLKGWTRRSQEALQKFDVAGLGILAYRWDDDFHATFEVVYTWQLSLDPNTIDFENIRWAARKIRMPLRRAYEVYGHPKDEDGNEIFPDVEEAERMDSMRMDIWLYWDHDTEVHQYDSTTIHEDKNRYGAVPLLFLQAHPDPGPSIWPISNNVLAAGLQNSLTTLNDITMASAMHGGPITYADMARMGNEGKEALENKRQQGVVPVDDTVSPPIGRIPAEQFPPQLIEYTRKIEQAIDAIMGVNEQMRGVITSDPKFATQVAAVQQSSGAMSNKSRIEFERFLVRMAEVAIMMEIEFGGPTLDPDGKISTPDEVMQLWMAMKDVSEINVLECSTTYKDPTFELQQAMQRLNAVAQLLPLFGELGGQLPNLVELVNDVYRYSNIHDVSRYWMQAPPKAPPQPEPPKVSISLRGELSPTTAMALAEGQAPPPEGADPEALAPQPTGSGMQPPQIPS